jgi:isoquinoline 1-oxidoreductase subunit beta
MAIEHQINRRQFMVTTSVLGGAFVLGFVLPSRQVKAATIAEKPWNSPTTGGTEVNAWLIIGTDDSVTIRVAQSEMGEGVFTSMPMLVAEELECDWTKVRAEYAYEYYLYSTGCEAAIASEHYLDSTTAVRTGDGPG